MTTPISAVKGIGPKSTVWLRAVGIMTLDDLEVSGAVDAYIRIKEAFPKQVTLNALWGLQSVLTGIPWDRLPEDMKADLKRQVEEEQAGRP